METVLAFVEFTTEEVKIDNYGNLGQTDTNIMRRTKSTVRKSK